MPELPEVEVTRLGLSPELEGARVTGVTARTLALRYPLPQDLSQRLTGKRLQAMKRRGKYLLLDFGDGHLLIHLGMSGSLRLVRPGTPPEKHDHLDVGFRQGHREHVLRYRDPRRFGAVLWLAGDPYAHPLLAVLGLEPFDAAFTGDWLFTATRGLKAAIKPVLMDGHRLVGVGNIYASESLFRAGIDPRVAAGSLSRLRCGRLVAAVRETLAAALAAGGSSLRDFVHSDGASGYFQLQTCVYDRAEEPCRRCGSPIRHLRQGQRATYYCPRCQR